MAKITKRTVDALEPRDREHVLWDDEIKGFGVRVRPSGRKTYIVKYRDRGRAVKVTIGPHGAISPAAARARAAEIVTAARTGKDLSGRDLRDAKAPTVAELGRRFLDEYVTDHCKPNTKRQYRKMVEGYILPRLGARRVPDVQRIDVVSLHHDMRATPTTANRMLATLSRMFAVAEIWQIRPDGSNPCRNIKHFREERRERFLSDEEYRRLGEVLREVEREGSERPSAIAAIRLLMLTGCRKGEILTLRWEFVDLERGELRLPDRKTGVNFLPMPVAVIQSHMMPNHLLILDYFVSPAFLPSCIRDTQTLTSPIDVMPPRCGLIPRIGPSNRARNRHGGASCRREAPFVSPSAASPPCRPPAGTPSTGTATWRASACASSVTAARSMSCSPEDPPA